MPLPVLETIKYETVVPSTKKKIEFRPFLVKEEKILLLAQEADDEVQIVNAVKEIIDVCTFNKLVIPELAVYDLEFLFLQIRSKSVGEDVEFNIQCKECETQNEQRIDLSTVKVVYPKEKQITKLELSDTIGITLRSPSVDDILGIKNSNDVVEIMALCIETVYDADKVFDRKDLTKKELAEFVESFSHDHMQKIDGFMSNQPTLKHTLKFKCTKCGADNEQNFEGLQDFFA